MHTPPALYFLHWKFLNPFISLQRTEQTQISPFITTLMLSLFLSKMLSLFLSKMLSLFLSKMLSLFLSNAQDGLPEGRLHGRDPVRRSKPLVILSA